MKFPIIGTLKHVDNFPNDTFTHCCPLGKDEFRVRYSFDTGETMLTNVQELYKILVSGLTALSSTFILPFNLANTLEHCQLHCFDLPLQLERYEAF